MAKNDGGPAFPCKWENPNGVPFTEFGMSLRDWFAGQALAGLLASPDGSVYRHTIETERTSSPAPTVAALACELADAMIDARNGG